MCHITTLGQSVASGGPASSGPPIRMREGARAQPVGERGALAQSARPLLWAVLQWECGGAGSGPMGGESAAGLVDVVRRMVGVSLRRRWRWRREWRWRKRGCGSYRASKSRSVSKRAGRWPGARSPLVVCGRRSAWKLGREI
ncbi:hypothetical protein chiPu_0023535 [Chiloscyllium punctatum]|uniref:Uncharacterized protein n=1 Tax=Chiloscyllium punctatum TaxID=137246 RepID=A0A401TAB1_CHIPU|nr:hypothetical protein [Chiloscyllium punctatum]